MVKVKYFLKSVPLMSTKDISGFSPPSVFVGRIGYPYVYVGPLVPPVHEDTSLFDLPEQWFGRSIDEIVVSALCLSAGNTAFMFKGLMKQVK